jgi:uncharacterized protein
LSSSGWDSEQKRPEDIDVPVLGAQSPGVYFENAPSVPQVEFQTGIPAFLGILPGAPATLARLDRARFAQIDAATRIVPGEGYMRFALRGFFENGGSVCHIVAAEPNDASLDSALEALATVDEVDVVCAPDLGIEDDIDTLSRLQRKILRFCADHNAFAILDSIRRPGALPDEDIEAVLAQRGKLDADSTGAAGALYFPWLQVRNGCSVCQGSGQQNGNRCTVCAGSGAGTVPPCGHMAGVYARTDESTGVHKAPANEAVHGILNLQLIVNGTQQATLNPQGVNCIRAFPGRGTLVWGARTLSRDSSWTYINVRRLMLTVRRWLEQIAPSFLFEPNDAHLWIRINRELDAFFEDLFAQGALQGRTPHEAFYVKCDAETNPPDVRADGKVVVEIGLAPAKPSEFVVIRLTGGPGGVSLSEP